MRSLFESTMAQLKSAIEERGSIRSLADALDMNPSTVSRWFSEGRSPDFRGLAEIFAYLGVQIVFPGESPKEGQSGGAPEKDLLARIAELEKENFRKEGAIALLKEQLAEARGEHAGADGRIPQDMDLPDQETGEGRTA